MIYFSGETPLDDHRKTKNDKKAKREYNKYKKGGALRVQKREKKENEGN